MLYQESTLRELIHFYRDLKNRVDPIFRNFGNVLPYNADFLPKTKMVRMVYTNNFYESGLENSEGKTELGPKSKILGRSKI